MTKDTAKNGAYSLRKKDPVRWVALAGFFMALNIVFSSWGIPVPGGHLYLCDTVINIAAILMDPVAAFIVGGLGSFLGDAIFYPAPMFVSLVTHGLQAVAVSLIAHRAGASDTKSKQFRMSLIGVLVGAVIMVVGYTLGKIFVYSTLQYAIIKLPYEIAQALLGVVGSLFLCFKAGILKIYRRMELNN
ncbi:MAG: ECF transporter S component [Lachnospiraceae bacterium]|nr:ECF transporter S component [Lachnospiraceae bacterium]MDD4525556.1 ECF transporter S component [Lachnospiraceae bacterium]